MPVDFSNAKPSAPPRRSGRQPSQTTTAVNVHSLRELREEGLNGVGQVGQALALSFRQFADAATIGQYFPPIARELAALADTYDALAKPIDLIIQVGPFGALLAAVAPFAMQMLTNHKIVNAVGVMGVVSPEMLSAQIQAQMFRMQAEALKEQQEMQKLLEEAQADLASAMAGANPV